VKALRDWLKTNPCVEALYENFLSSKVDMPAANVALTQQSKDPIDASFNVRPVFSFAKPLKELKCFSTVQTDCFFDMVCQICAIGEVNGVKFLLTWDATKCG
jgi:hypothetical protein